MKKSFLLFTVLFFSFNFYQAVFAAEGDKNETSIISIDSAERSEYKKDEESDGDIIVLTGSVKISVTKGNSKTTITADKVNYNRSSEMLFAEGNVTLEQSKGSSSGGEKISARSLLFNTSTLEGVFDNGRAVQTSSDAINLPSGSTLIVSSDIFGRDSGGTIAFKNGELTFCDDENPHWKIRAKRIWLLPGGEFAFLSALLYVGRIPLLYLPAFYYPKDELIFNPAMGYKNREGYFINTTTYLYGRKPADAASTSDGDSKDKDKINLFSFMKTGSLKEQVREGLVLHNLDDDYSGDTKNHVKIMADYYSNLGAMVGSNVVLSPSSIFSTFEFNTEVGFSNTIFKDGKTYIPYNSKGDKVLDKSNFMGLELPFRYQANLKLAISKPFSISLSMPLYSDPYFNYDFNKRAETMDWIDFLMSGVDDSDNTTQTTVSSFTWALNGSHTFSIADFFKPYISSLSLSSFSSSIVYSSRNATLTGRSEYSNDSLWATYTPERQFYFPSQITPLKVSARIGGTIFQYPAAATTKKQTTNLSLLLPEDLKTEEDKKKEQEQKEQKQNQTDSDKKEYSKDEEKLAEEKNIIFEQTVLPSIATVNASTKSLSGINYKLSYTISPEFSSQLSYSSLKLNVPEDFDWKTLQSTYIQVKSPTVLTSVLGYKDSFLSLTDSFTFNPVYQSHPYLSTDTNKGGYSESAVNSIKKADYSAKKLDLTNTNALSFKPFYYTEYFSATALTWNTNVKMIRTKYISDDVNNPEWEYLTTDLTDEDCVTTHNLNMVLAAKEGDYSQQLSLTTTLPPQVDSYSGIFSLGFPNTSFAVSTGIKQRSSTDETWVKQNISQTLSVKFFSDKLNLSQSYVYDWEKEEQDSLKFSLSGYGAQLAYTMSYTTDYEFVIDGTRRKGWQSSSNKRFQPYSLSLAYTNPSKTFKYWTQRISWSPSLSASLVYDFVRPTSSYFVFIPKITFKVNNFLDFSFSAESRNSVFYRYFCPQSDYDYYYNSKGQRSFVQDLIDSFRFDNDDIRKKSGFKLKSLVMTITHDLDDWDLNCSFKISPRYIAATSTTKAHYDFSPYFSLSVSWRPLSGMKTEIKDEYGKWSLN
ncbi:LPS-assembly protein LptD [Treponema pectinovorum]|uniref:LPS-assembly protein LptD n=1 Tax=Treponema pectinovorum TaxID=164 RepID=UPI0011CC499C|nr:LPS-assembly protein LptD [Treponema pectinovorum]